MIDGSQTVGPARRSIRAKLTLLVLASVGLAVTLVTGVLAWRDGQRETALSLDRLSSAAQVVASMSEEAAAAGDRARAYGALRSITMMPDVAYARIERPDGSLLAETGAGVRLTRDVSATAGGQHGFFNLLSSRTGEVTAPIVYARHTVGRVVLFGRLGEGVARLFSSLLLSLAAGLTAALAGLAVAARLQRRISGPVVALTAAMQEVRESHDYGRTADIAADDEVGDLVDGFNEMLSEIRTRDQALAAHMAGLEKTVAQRTHDLKLAKDAAEAANSAKSDFLATMSHEIRTPMNGVMVMAEMLAAGELPPKQRRFAEVIAKSGSSLLAIINDILDFSKIEAGKMGLEAAPVDPGEVVEDVLALFWERARSKGLDLAAYIDPSTPALIEGDATRLRQVIGNLVNNAIKFTETGAVMVQVTPKDEFLRISVRDTGVGIPKDKIGGLFEAFTQADQSTTRRFGGTGLGLAICKRLVEAMGGRFYVTSEEGKGSVFAFDLAPKVLAENAKWPAWPDRVAGLQITASATRSAVSRYLQTSGVTFEDSPSTEPPDLLLAEPALLAGHPRQAPLVICLGEYGDSAPQALQSAGLVDLVLILPLRRRELAAALSQLALGGPLDQALAAASRADAAVLPSFHGRRVLVADDSAVNREVAMEALARLDIAATLVPHGRAAVEAVTKAAEPFDLILMDGSMPELDGYEAAQEIRRFEEAGERPRIPIVALTAHVVGSPAERWRQSGMDGVLAKPSPWPPWPRAWANSCPRAKRRRCRSPAPRRRPRPSPRR
ncbi:MAG: ATP-binding protein [Caulobacterales bacterium]